MASMGISPAKEYPKLLKSLQERFDLAVNDRNYKRGSFRGQINLHCFASSNGVRERAFRDLHGSLMGLQRSNLCRMDPIEFMTRTMVVLEIENIFNADIKAQGMYVPPMTIQTYDTTTTGNVNSTRTTDDDGNITEMSGDQPLEVPGRPAAFNAAQAQRVRDMGFSNSRNGRAQNSNTAAGGDQRR